MSATFSLERWILRRFAVGDTDVFHHNVRRRGFFGPLYLSLFGTPQLGSYANGRYLSRVLRRRHFASILDAGCGDGTFSFWLARHLPQTRVLGVDIGEQGLHTSETTLDVCHRIQSELRLPNLRFERRDLRRLDLYEEFDLAISFDVLEHIRENYQAMVQIYASLRPGGWFLLRIPAQVQRRVLPARYLANHDRWAAAEHLGQHYDMPALLTDLQHIGFHIVEALHTTSFWGRLSFEIPEALRYYRIPEPVIFAVIPLLKGLCHVDTLCNPSDGDGLLVLAAK